MSLLDIQPPTSDLNRQKFLSIAQGQKTQRFIPSREHIILILVTYILQIQVKIHFFPIVNIHLGTY